MAHLWPQRSGLVDAREEAQGSGLDLGQVFFDGRSEDGVRGVEVAVGEPVAVKVIRTPVQALRANATWERVIVHTIRRESLDRMLILGRRHLEAVLVEYVGYYNAHRPHRSLDQRSPSALDMLPR